MMATMCCSHSTKPSSSQQLDNSVASPNWTQQGLRGSLKLGSAHSCVLESGSKGRKRDFLGWILSKFCMLLLVSRVLPIPTLTA